MAVIPTRTLENTAAEHLADHTELTRLHNILDLSRVKFVNITSGNLAVPSTKAYIPGTEIVIAATAGDVLDLSLAVQFADNGTTNYIDWDVATTNPTGSVAVNFASTGTTTSGAIGGWTMRQIGYFGMQGNFFYTVVAGDVFSGTVTLRLWGVAASASRTVFAQAGAPLQFGVRNLGKTI